MKKIVKKVYLQKIEKLLLPLIIILGLIVRIISLGRRPFDGDEGLIGLTVKDNLHWLVTKGAMDVQPFGYHFLSFISTKIFAYFALMPKIRSSYFSSIFK